MKYVVVAGKFDGNERNTKYISPSYDTFEQALQDFIKSNDYPFCEIEASDGIDTTWILTPYKE